METFAFRTLEQGKKRVPTRKEMRHIDEEQTTEVAVVLFELLHVETLLHIFHIQFQGILYFTVRDNKNNIYSNIKKNIPQKCCQKNKLKPMINLCRGLPRETQMQNYLYILTNVSSIHFKGAICKNIILWPNLSIAAAVSHSTPPLCGFLAELPVTDQRQDIQHDKRG